MYCRKCYADLGQATLECPKCGREFDPAKPRTFLKRPFPSNAQIVWQIIGTTLLGIIAAYIVAFHQAAAMSGH